MFIFTNILNFFQQFFLNSFRFWGAMAVAGVAVPIAIHLFSRYRSKIVDWAAMELLRRALVVRARRVRMEDLILLALRCLAILLLAFALARPFIRSAGLIGEANVGVVIAVDSSFSMSHNPAGQSRYDAARQRIREIASTLGSDDQVTVVQLGEKAHVRLENVGRNDERLQDFIAGSNPLPESLNLEACMPEIRRIVGDLKTTRKECYLITDAQQSSWGSVSAGVRDMVHEMSTDCEMVYVPVGSEHYDNLAITRLALASGVLRKGMQVRYNVDVENTGRTAASNVTVKLLVGNRGVAEQAIERIEPDETVTTSLRAEFPEEGEFAVTAQIGGNDPLPIDNQRYAVTTIRNKIKILCVETKPVADQKQNESFYLYSLLVGSIGAEKGGPSAPVEWKTVAASAMQPADLEGVDVAILADVGEVSRPQAVALSKFVSRGGGLMVYMGNRVNPAQLNSQLRDAEGHEILPASLGEAIGQTRETLGARHGGSAFLGWGLNYTPPDHPVTRFVSTLPQQLWDEIRIQRYMKAAPYAGAKVLLSLTTDDPFLIERPIGRGSVLLCTSTANREWADEFPTHPAFGMLTNQAIMYLTRQSAFATATVGQDIACRLPPGATADDCHVTGPDGHDVLFRTVAGKDGLQDAVFTAELPGAYTLKAGNAEVKTAANVDPKESDVRVLRGQALSAALAGMPLRLVEDGQSLRETEIETRHGREIWRIVLYAVLAVLVIEALLSRWFGHRLSEESSPGVHTTRDIGVRSAGRLPQETPVGAST